MSERTGVQRRTLAGALVLAAVSGAGLLALVENTDDDGRATRIAEVVTTTSEVTTTEAPTTLVTEAPTTAPPATAAPSVEQQVAEHEQRIDTLEATTTTAPQPQPADQPPTTSTSSSSTTTTLYLG